VTNDPEAPTSSWLLRAVAERANGDKLAARASLQHVIQTEPGNVAALVERAELYVEDANYEHAVEDLKTAETIKNIDKSILSRVAIAYERAGKPDDARRVAESAGLIRTGEEPGGGKTSVIGTSEEIAAANSEDPATARKALQKLLQKNPRSAMLLARLGASYRTDDPGHSLDFYRRASEIQPGNPEYAIGYASSLVRARRFAEATIVLRRVIAESPDSYTAHANLATALYELKHYADAIPEYEWLLKSKPDLTITYYFIGSAHDYLGEYKEALAAYEAFLRLADTRTNQLEIDKVKLRLPSLRHQIEIGQGVKRKQ
jgi:tetratricopeptide (TPR) repeat protein